MLSPLDFKTLKVFKPDDFPNYLPKLNHMYDELFSGGKGFRAKLIHQIGTAINLPQEVILLLAQTIEFIHNASLLHDDLVDRSPLRRGKTSAWLKFTPEYAVLAGDYLLARVMVNLSSHGNVELIQFTSHTISDLLEGEWIQDSLLREFDVPLEQLDRVHNLKTGSLFKWCLRAPFIAKLNKHEALHQTLDELGTLLGLLFQRSDDLLDFDVRNGEKKEVLSDLHAGYLNSFGVFLLSECSKGLKQEALVSSSLQQLKAAVTEAYFNKKVKEFDELNAHLIRAYQHHLEVLRTYLRADELSMIDEISQLPQILYWRSKP